MAIHMLATRPNAELLTLPWGTPLADWDPALDVPLARGIHRHVVRFIRVTGQVYAVKETRESFARGEYALLRNLKRLGLPTVVPIGVVTGREAPDGQTIEPALVTRHLTHSLPYRALFSHHLQDDTLDRLIDALVVLVVRLHVEGFYWGDCSLSNALFRRSAGEFAAYLVDAETGELHDTLSDGQRAHDLEILRVNMYGELLDLQAGGLLDEQVDPESLVERVLERYDALWTELTGAEVFGTDEMWRIEQRMERLNLLGFDVDELDVVTDFDGHSVRIQPRVVEANHHARSLQRLTGLDLEEPQARRILNDLEVFTAAHDLAEEDRSVAAYRWLNEVYRPLQAMIPAAYRDVVEPAEAYHDVLVHRWFMSESVGKEVNFFDALRSYVDDVLPHRVGVLRAAETNTDADTD